MSNSVAHTDPRKSVFGQRHHSHAVASSTKAISMHQTLQPIDVPPPLRAHNAAHMHTLQFPSRQSRRG